ncbi:hypothetical protein [Halobacteriovorax sp.]|uniref:hypothetical protein n=1 Tax=Halobacteriovorax sp. TaxID=2020862 RepID=UPI003567EC5F
MRKNNLLKFVIVFIFLSFFIEPLTGHVEVAPFYSWEMFTSVKKEMIFYKLSIGENHYSSLKNELDGLSHNQKDLIKELSKLNEVERDEVLRSEFDVLGKEVKLEKVYVNLFDYYNGKDIEKNEVLWKVYL